MILAAAVERSGLHERIALNVIRAFGTRPRNVIAGFMVTTGMISAWMTNTATTVLMLPIAASIILLIKNDNERSRFGTCIMLCVAYSASIGGMATLVGTPPNAVFASLAKSLVNLDVSFEQWMLLGVPVSAVALVFAWWYMVNFGAKIGNEPIVEEKNLVLNMLSALGHFTRKEKLVGIVFAVTALLWITRGIVWGKLVPMIDDSTIAIASALALFAISSGKNQRVIDWTTAAKIPWGVLFLIGGGLALSSGFTTTGLDKWLAEQFTSIGATDLIIVLAIIVAFAIFSGEVMSNTAGAALIIPVAASIAPVLNISPISLMLPIALATSFSFVLPSGTAPNAIVFGSGYVTIKQMARAGFPLDLFGVLCVTILTMLLVPIVFS
jgi:sodium-dependent dicarboxylate transporter 2/3/5